ncbi:MAG: glycosyltransferase family 4 protein [Vicinamibacteria bacterium]
MSASGGPTPPRREIALVVQRYGEAITGGSEQLARALAERLAERFRVSVYTTCARDYVSWRSELPEGEREEGGVRVLRFAAEEERDLASFNRLSDGLYGRPASREEELHWLRRQGPYVPRLVERLRADHDRYAAVLFFTYLYYPTVAGLAAVPERSILVSTAHDEPAIRLGIFREAFARARAFAFLTPPEAELVERLFGVGGRPAAVAGIGIDTGPPPDVEAFKIRHDVVGPYALYAGRIDAGKGCAELVDFYSSYRRDRRGAAELLLVGRLAMPEPRAPGARYLGFLPEEEKRAALAGAAAVVCPSPYESLSIVLLEGMALGAPALASARSPVLVDHCRRSNAGLYYASREEFGECLDLLVTQERLRGALSANGRGYVLREYGWPAVLDRYLRLIEAVGEDGSARAS